MNPAEFKPVDWPKASIGGTEYTLRLSYPAHAQLYAWGFAGVPNVPIAAWAAAMAGHFDKKGRWKSARFENWLDVADALLDDEQQPLMDAVDEAIKKVSPESKTTVQADPADQAPGA